MLQKKQPPSSKQDGEKDLKKKKKHMDRFHLHFRMTKSLRTVLNIRHNFFYFRSVFYTLSTQIKFGGDA